jgi:alkylhydroperoxidase family enzyme
MLGLVERKLGKPLAANRILGWSPRTLAGSGLMEALVVHDDPEVPRRLLKLLRIFVSYSASCPFCIDLNAQGHAGDGVTDDELRALGQPGGTHTASFSAAERAALEYAACLTHTPVRLPEAVVVAMKEHFSDRAFTIIAATVAQVNFWTRLIQGLGVNEAGFSSDPTLLELERFRTRTP